MGSAARDSPDIRSESWTRLKPALRGRKCTGRQKPGSSRSAHSSIHCPAKRLSAVNGLATTALVVAIEKSRAKFSTEKLSAFAPLAPFW